MVLQAVQADVVVPPFLPGTKDVISISATAVDANDSATVQIQATDGEGNVHTCDAVVFNVEFDPPTCEVTATVVATNTLSFTAQDTGSGIASVTTIGSSNATPSIPSFTPGTNDPVVISVTPADSALPSAITFRITDDNGNARNCPPVVWQRLALTKNGQTKGSLSVGLSTPFLTLKNGSPGFDRVKIAIGRSQTRQSLEPGQILNQDYSSSLSPGGTPVTLQAWGKGGPAALFMFSNEFLP